LPRPVAAGAVAAEAEGRIHAGTETAGADAQTDGNLERGALAAGGASLCEAGSEIGVADGNFELHRALRTALLAGLQRDLRVGLCQSRTCHAARRDRRARKRLAHDVERQRRARADGCRAVDFHGPCR